MSLLRRRLMFDDKIDWKIEVEETTYGAYIPRGTPHRKVGDTYIINPKSSYMPVDSCVGTNTSAGIMFWIKITPHIPCPIKLWCEGMNYFLICSGGYPVGLTAVYSGEENGTTITWNYQYEADTISCDFSTWNGTTTNSHMSNTESAGDVVPNAYLHVEIIDTDVSTAIPICKKDWYIAIQEMRHYFTYDASLHDGYSGPTHNIDFSWHTRLRDSNDVSLYGSQTESALSSYSEAKGVPEFLVEKERANGSATIVQRFRFKNDAPILVKRRVFSSSSSLGLGRYIASWTPYSGAPDASLYHNMYVNSCFAFKVITNCCKFAIANISSEVQRTSIGCNNTNDGTHGFAYVRGKETPDASTSPTFGNGVVLDTDIMYDELGNHCESTIWVVFKGHNLSARDSSSKTMTIVMRGYKGAGLSTTYRVDSSSTGVTLWPKAMYKIQTRWTFPRDSASYYNTLSSNSLQYYDITYNNAAGATGGTSNPSLMELPGGDLTDRYHIGYFTSSSGACPNIGSSGLFYSIAEEDFIAPIRNNDTNIDSLLATQRTNLLYTPLTSTEALLEETYGMIAFVGITYNGYYSYNSSKYWRINTWGMDNIGNNSQHTKDSSYIVNSVFAGNGSIGIKTNWTFTNSSSSTAGNFTYHATQRAIGVENPSNYMAHYLRPQAFVINTLWQYPTY